MKTKILFVTALLAAQSLMAQTPSEQLAQASSDFLYSDLGSISRYSLKTNTLPAKIALTGVVLEGRSQGWIGKNSVDYKAVLQRFGFYTPNTIMNAPASMKTDFSVLPMGLTEKDIRMGLPGVHVTGLNVSCASCHAGHTYNEKGQPTKDAWLGLPNTSINMEGYVDTIYRGLERVKEDNKAAHSLMKQIFPDMSKSELATAKMFIYRTVNQRIGKLEGLYDRAVPFSNGGPGVTNGVAALKLNLDLMERDRMQPEYGFTSIPALGDRLLRSSFLYDGVYAAPGVERFQEKSSWTNEDSKEMGSLIALFTIPTMGNSQKGALAVGEKVSEVMTTLISNYKAPTFPGEVDIAKAYRGFKIFQENCAHCHGTYEWTGAKPELKSYPNRLVSVDYIGTDESRLNAVSDYLVTEFNKSPLASAAIAAKTGGYVAPLLNSLWATAPYLHNGSVPSLYDLMHPETRPTKFMVGGHNLDYKKMGLKLVRNPQTGVYVYPADVKPWSVPVVYDTTTPGRGNHGHVTPFNRLTEDEKSSLLEYLKLL
ncbi:MAG: hypothetical protein ACM3MG_04790 [Bacillota bacterium]